MPKKKKRLPKDFRELLEAGDLDRLKAVFDTHELDARDGPDGPTALGMYGCSPELATWLVGQGADPQIRWGYDSTALGRHMSVGNAPMVETLLDLGVTLEASEETRGMPPLVDAALRLKPAIVQLLLDRGADPRATDRSGRAALESALMATRNTSIPNTAEIAAMLLTAGVTATDEMREEVTRIGEEFEFHRKNFAADGVAEVDAALGRLYALFDVNPVAPRREHDGVAPIIPAATGWQAQMEELWALLVPSAGAATTVQGEVVRIAGRVRDEQYRNGGANWNADFRKMLSALLGHLGSGTSLAEADLALARAAGADAADGQGDEQSLDMLCRLAVAWVLLNPQPVALPKPAYRR